MARGGKGAEEKTRESKKPAERFIGPALPEPAPEGK